MRMYFDSRWIGTHGIGRFANELKLRLAVDGYIESSVRPYDFFDCIFFAYYIFIRKGIFITPGFNAPVFFYKNIVITLHDLNHIDLPYNSGFLKRAYYSFILKRAVRGCRAVLTVSDFSKSKISHWANIPLSKIINVGNGVDQGFSTRVAPFLPGYRYLLCVGNRKRHKNEARILLAFSKAMIANDIKLVFSGAISEELKLIIDEYQLAERVVFLGNISEDDLPCVYRGALGLVFPSLYEGFGLPVVEAMACGVPVLTSNTTSLPEVAGDSALLVNPESVDEIRVGIERLVHDEALRAELIAKGLERAKLFSWDAVAARVQAVLDEVTSQYGK
jgi:glycosyltransferase involved in cell wall biosynthesis